MDPLKKNKELHYEIEQLNKWLKITNFYFLILSLSLFLQLANFKNFTQVEDEEAIDILKV